MTAIPQMEPWFGDEEKLAVREYMDQGGWLTEFRKTRELEERLAEYVGASHCVLTSNGTIALTLALMALGIGRGDEVIVPDYTMIASANSVRLAGADPVLVDIDRSTLCLDLDAVDRAITPRTRAVMLVTINGRYPDMDAAVSLCRDRGLFLVEDAAQSLGSRYGGKHLGTFGTLGCFSFSVPKVITTGQGGAVVTDDPDLDEKLRLIKDFGRRQAGMDQHDVLGFNFKFTDLQAVIGIEQMKKLPWRVERKKEIFGLYKELLADLEDVEFIPTDPSGTSPWFVDIMVESGVRNALMAFLKEREIGSRPFYPAIHTQPPYSDSSGDFPRSLEVSARGVWLPSSSVLSDEEIGRVCDAVRKFFSADSG